MHTHPKCEEKEKEDVSERAKKPKPQREREREREREGLRIAVWLVSEKFYLLCFYTDVCCVVLCCALSEARGEYFI